MVPERGHSPAEFIQLLREKLLVDWELAKAFAFLRLQVGFDQFEQASDIRSLDLRQESAFLRRIERDLVPHETLEASGVEVTEIVRVLQRFTKEDFPSDQFLIERGGQVGRFITDFLLMVELEIQALAEESERGLRIGVVAEQRLAILDNASLAGIGIALRPLLHDGLQLFGLPRVLEMKRVIEVILFASRDELGEHRRAIRSQSKFLHETDLVIGTGTGGNEQRKGEQEERASFHKNGERRPATNGDKADCRGATLLWSGVTHSTDTG